MTSNRGRRRAEAQARARRRRTAAFAALGVIALLGVSVGVFALARDAGDDDAGTDDPASEDATDRPEPGDVRDGSRLVEGPSAFTIDAVDEYRIVYRVDDYAGGTKVTTTEDVRVRRPFDGRVERRQGGPPGGDVTSAQLSRFGVLSVPAGAEGVLTLAVPPEPASSDLRFDIALDDLVERGDADRREWREVAGVDCRVHRLAEPVTTGEPAAWSGDDDNYADLCVSEAGLLLEELWVTDGRALRHRIAVEADPTDAQLTDELLEVTSEPLTPDQGGGALLELDPESAPLGTSWALPAPPEGFEPVGRFGADAPRQSAQPTATTSSLVDVWRRGHDVLLLEQGTAPPATSAATADEVTAGDLGTGRLILGLRLNEVRVERDGGQTIRVRATLPPDALLDVARAVRQVDGGTGLRPLG